MTRPWQPAILLIDNEARFLEVIARMLTIDDEVKIVGTATSCEEALLLLEHLERPDLVVIDVQMPGRDGFQTAHSLLERQPELKILLMSGAPDAAYPDLSIEVGAVGFLPKRDLSSQALVDLAAELALQGQPGPDARPGPGP